MVIWERVSANLLQRTELSSCTTFSRREFGVDWTENYVFNLERYMIFHPFYWEFSVGGNSRGQRTLHVFHSI